MGCPYCGYVIECATGTRLPSAGDISICIECLNILEFDENLAMKKLSVETFAALRRDEKSWNEIEYYRTSLRVIKSLAKLKNDEKEKS